MVPDLRTTLRWRAAARAWLRVAGVMSLPAGLMFLAAWIIEGLYDGDLTNYRYYFWRILSGLLFTSWGVIGVAFAGWVSCLMFPVPRWPPRCPFCRHSLVALREARCTECGRRLPEEYVESSVPPPEGGT